MSGPGDPMSSNPWASPDSVDFFAANRRTIAEVYASEKHFLDLFLAPQMSVLDFGCAAGGFAAILADTYGIDPKHYCGVDATAEMLAIARRRFPETRFLTSLSPLLAEGQTFDFVFSFGVLHMVLDWRRHLADLVRLTGRYLVFDLRLVQQGQSIEDPRRSCQVLRYGGTDGRAGKVPYVIVNADEAQKTIGALMEPGDRLVRHGYRHPVGETVVSPLSVVDMTCFCLIKGSGGHPPAPSPKR